VPKKEALTKRLAALSAQRVAQAQIKINKSQPKTVVKQKEGSRTRFVRNNNKKVATKSSDHS